jgi:hypothetical protein
MFTAFCGGSEDIRKLERHLYVYGKKSVF